MAEFISKHQSTLKIISCVSIVFIIISIFIFAGSLIMYPSISTSPMGYWVLIVAILNSVAGLYSSWLQFYLGKKVDYNLTEDQKKVLMWFVKKIRSRELPASFYFVYLSSGQISIDGQSLANLQCPTITESTMGILNESKLIYVGQKGSRGFPFEITDKAYKAVDSNFKR
ncbi:MAG: hypothetical protein CVU41_19360 [Chloroflexi bacterium HGW-Chloroflexi-3]|nr:MAG: hypothetical protein CVU41_19360 [Chloroflexi bacterium HGW-Chloroflexi-3]